MNEDLIRRVQDALKYDLREMDAVFTPLLNDVLAELTKTKTPKAKPVSLMIALGEPGKSPSTTDVVADARARMEANPLPCIAKATVKGDRATFKVKDAVSSADECGFHVAEDVGYGSIVVIAKVIMLHITRVFGVTAARMEESGDRAGGWDVEFNRELTEDEVTKLEAFLGQE